MQKVPEDHPEIPVAKMEQRYYLVRSSDGDRHYIAPPHGAHLVMDAPCGTPIRVGWDSILEFLHELNSIMGHAA